DIIKGGIAKYGIVNPIFKPSPIEPRFSEYLVFEGISVDEMSDGVDAPRRHPVCQGDGVELPPKETSMEQATTIGLDIAKHVFQLHGADAAGHVLFRKRITRVRLLSFLAAQTRCVVAMEACAGAHYWAREIAKGPSRNKRAVWAMRTW